MVDYTFIAGGSKGLGAQLLDVFIGHGHQAIEFSRSGSSHHHVDCDFNQTSSAQQIFDATFSITKDKPHTSINLVVNTATLAPFGGLQDADQNTINQHLSINIDSTVALIRRFLMAHQNTDTKKTITYISSGAARRAIPGLAMYSASKAFFERLIDTLAEEQKQQQFPINCMVINPGVMNTDMQAEIRNQDKRNFPMVDMWNEWHQQGNLADPNDIARVCYQIISEKGNNGDYFTAQELLND